MVLYDEYTATFSDEFTKDVNILPDLVDIICTDCAINAKEAPLIMGVKLRSSSSFEAVINGEDPIEATLDGDDYVIEYPHTISEIHFTADTTLTTGEIGWSSQRPLFTALTITDKNGDALDDDVTLTLTSGGMEINPSVDGTHYVPMGTVHYIVTDGGVVAVEGDIVTRGESELTVAEDLGDGGHIPEVVPAVEPTCTETGLTEGSICSICGETLVAQTEVDALGHDWSAWTETTAPTCTEAGEEERECSRCDETETRTVAALGHDWGEWTPTEEEGVESRECSRCHEVETRTTPENNEG